MKIQISGIKSLVNYSTPLNLGAISIITGKNSAGKSSFTNGLKLLNNVLQNNSFMRLIDLMKINFNNQTVWLNSNISNLFNSDTFKFTVESDFIVPIKTELVFKKFQNEFKLETIGCYENDKLIVIKKIHDFSLNTYSIKLLAGNLSESFWSILEKALSVYETLSENEEFLLTCIEYSKSGKLNLEILADMEMCLEELNLEPDNLFNTINGIELLLIISNYLNEGDIVDFKSYVANNFTDVNVFNDVISDDRLKFSSQLYDIFLNKNSKAQTFFSLNAIKEEREVIESELNFIIGNLHVKGDLESYTKEYLLRAEVRSNLDFLNNPDEVLVNVHRNSRSVMLLSIINDWVDAIAVRELNSVKEFQFDNHNKSDQDLFYLSKDKSQLHEIADYFFNKNYAENIINDYLILLQIGKNIIFEQHMYGESYMIFIENNEGQKVNIASLGSGHYYIVRLLLNIIYKIYQRNELLDVKYRETYIQEDEMDYPIKLILTEPETHLHPNLQSMLCATLVSLSKNYNVSFLIETHSEYLIRGLQLQIAKKEVSHKDVNIYYFENKNVRGTEIRKIKIDNYGLFVDKFGTGFLDESQNTIEQLLKIKEN